MEKGCNCSSYECKCFVSNSIPKVFDYIISLIKTGLICYDKEREDSRNHGKQSLQSAINELNKINVPK